MWETVVLIELIAYWVNGIVFLTQERRRFNAKSSLYCYMHFCFLMVQDFQDKSKVFNRFFFVSIRVVKLHSSHLSPYPGTWLTLEQRKNIRLCRRFSLYLPFWFNQLIELYLDGQRMSLYYVAIIFLFHQSTQPSL